MRNLYRLWFCFENVNLSGKYSHKKSLRSSFAAAALPTKPINYPLYLYLNRLKRESTILLSWHLQISLLKNVTYVTSRTVISKVFKTALSYVAFVFCWVFPVLLWFSCAIAIHNNSGGIDFGGAGSLRGLEYHSQSQSSDRPPLTKGGYFFRRRRNSKNFTAITETNHSSVYQKAVLRVLFLHHPSLPFAHHCYCSSDNYYYNCHLPLPSLSRQAASSDPRRPHQN